MKVTDIIIYPVKGLKGISVPTATLTSRGFENDRKWMLIDSTDTFLSQRSHPQLAKYKTSITSSGDLNISKGSDLLVVHESEVTDTIVTAYMWEHEFPVHVASKRINDWWCDQLSSEVRMVYMGPQDIRIKNYIGDGDKTELSLADGYPYLIIGTESLWALNKKLPKPIPMDRFRPNIVIETQQPHIEDTWRHIQIGSERLYIVKPCARCQVITIDQTTAEKSVEPLKTLATYRKDGSKVNFGANAVANTTGTISIGDIIM